MDFKTTVRKKKYDDLLSERRNQYAAAAKHFILDLIRDSDYAKLLGRVIRVDHVSHYKVPKHLKEKEEESGWGTVGEEEHFCPEEHIHGGSDSTNIYQAGHAYEDKVLANEFDIAKGVDLYAKANTRGAESSDGHDDGGKDPGRARKRGEKKEKKMAKKQRKKLRKCAAKSEKGE